MTGAQELRIGVMPTQIATSGMTAALTVTQILDSIAIRVNGPKAWSEGFTIDCHVTDLKEVHRAELSNGVLVNYPDPDQGEADLTLMLTRAQLLGLVAGQGMDSVEHTGDLGVLHRLLGLLDDPDPNFAVVTP